MEHDLLELIHEHLLPHGFRRVGELPGDDGIGWMAAWTRKTWNTNRAAAVIRMPDAGRHPGEYAREIRKPVGRALGYLPVLYPIGLQLVLVGPGVAGHGGDISDYVSRINNFTVLIQSIHLVDPDTRIAVTSRTWGQYITGKFQDAIVQALTGYVAVPDEEAPEKP